MEFLDILVHIVGLFKVQQIDGKPHDIYLIILCTIHALVMISAAVIYQVISYRIKTSLKGPSVDSRVIIPTNLNESLRSIFIGIILLPYSNLITHLTGLITNEASYYLIGSEDFVTILGVNLVMVGLNNFWKELNINRKDEAIRFDSFRIILIFNILIVVLVLLISNYNLSQSILALIIYLSFVFFVGITFRTIVKTYAKNSDNKLIKLRKNMIIAIILLFFTALSLLYFGFRISPSQPVPNTRKSLVEFFIISFDVIAILLSSFMISLVFLPEPFQQILGISKQEFIRYADPRFDKPFFYEIWLDQSLDEVTDFRSENYILAYKTDEIHIFSMIREKYKGQVLPFNQLDEELLSKLFLPTADVIFIDAHLTKTSTNILKSIARIYHVPLEYTHDGVIYHDNYLIESPKFVPALLVITPSFWNFRRKFWTILIQPELAKVIVNFLKDYKLYLEELAYSQKISIMVLKFSRIGGKIQDIPSITNSVQIPDPNYILLL